MFCVTVYVWNLINLIIIIIINLYFLQTRYNFRRGRKKTTLKDII